MSEDKRFKKVDGGRVGWDCPFCGKEYTDNLESVKEFECVCGAVINNGWAEKNGS